MRMNNNIIAKAYTTYSSNLRLYITKRINNIDEVEDILQDVFERLMGYDIVEEETIKSLCYTIANNLVVDHLRRHYKRQEVFNNTYLMMQKCDTNTPMQTLVCHDIAEKERCIMKTLSPSTARVYEMSQIKEMTIEEIAKELNISKRTVECHQFKARKVVREMMKKII